MNVGLEALFFWGCIFSASCVILYPNEKVNTTRYKSQLFTCTLNSGWTSAAISINSVNKFFTFNDDTCINRAQPPDELVTTTCNSTTRVFTLTLKNVTDEYNGKTIECANGNNKESTVMTVHYPPALLQINQEPQGIVEENIKVILNCEIIGGNPLGTIVWDCLGFTAAASSESFSNKKISSVERVVSKDDNGKECVCFGTHPLWKTTKNVSHEVKVKYPPIVTILPNDSPYKVLENTTDIRFSCIVTDTNPVVSSYSWKKDNNEVGGNMNFTIAIVERSQAGTYTCFAKNTAGTSNPSPVLQLYILYGVEMSTISKKEPHEGTTLMITCSGQSYPAITDNDVTWTKQNNKIFSTKGKQLKISNISRIDSGTYVCFVVIKLIPTVGETRNVTGRTMVEVDVLYKPNVTIYPNYVRYKVIENSTNLKLDCNVVDAKPAVTTYRWYKDGSEEKGFTSNSYSISTVLRSHTGNYTCRGVNTVGISDPSKSVELSVLYGVDIDPIIKKEPTELTNLSISCNVNSFPEVTNDDITWTKQNNAAFIRKGQQLVIDSIQRKDNGTYLCTVFLRLTPTIGQSVNVTGSTSVNVNVRYHPTVKVSPDYNQYNVIENATDIQLRCEVTDTNPAVDSYRWYKNNSVISTSHILSMSTVLRSHKGSYTCDATNTVGTSIRSSAVQLNILYGVELLPINKTTETEGNQLTISCNGQSNPSMTSNDVVWSKQNNSTFKSKGRQLVIENLNRLDSGTYVCFVLLKLTPTVGEQVNVTGSTFAEVVVLYRPDVTVSPDQSPHTVIENTTNLRLTCNVTDANPSVTSYRWYKDGVKVSADATYTLQTVYRFHAGSYACDALNTVGISKLSSVLQLHVLYGVSLKLSETEISINESEEWELSCTGDGNPLPKITCVNRYNRTTVGEQKANITFVSVDHANCVDTGLYICSGNNTIGEPVSQSADVKVACKPRTYNNRDKEDIFINGSDESLNISTRFISFPLSNMSWSRKLPDGNFTDLDNNFVLSTIPSQLPYETISILQKVKLQQDDYGIYLVNATNIHGSFVLKYHVIAKKSPDAPTNITANCDVTSMRVTWISRFNGGENQLFRINLVNSVSNKTLSKEGITDQGRDEIIIEKIESLSPDTLYLISVEAKNHYGPTNSKEIANCTTQKHQKDDQPVSSTIVGGISGSISALLIVVIIIGGLYLWRRRQVSGGNKELIKSGSKVTEEEEEGLKENPLYITSGQALNVDVGPVYGVVNKQKQKKENITFDENNDQGPVYSQVQKSTTQAKKKQKEKKEKKDIKKDSCKDIELGTVYENSEKLVKYKSVDELYANAEEQENSVNSSKVYSPKKNKDGLIYADLDLIPGPSGKQFVIRGLENRTNYAIIDLSIKVDPLPSDDEDEEKDNGNTKSLDNKGNE